jgi:hypothetical protein
MVRIRKSNDGSQAGASVGLEQQVYALTGIVRGLQQEVIELRRWHSKSELVGLVGEVYAEDVQRIEKLRDDAVKALNLLIAKGLITREELNEAIR